MRVLVADDSEVVRRGIKGLLSSETTWEVCGEATDGAEVLSKARQPLPDLMLLDISMPGLRGFEAVRRLRQEIPNAKILIMSNHDPIQLLPHAAEAGAHACLDKFHLGTDLLSTIKTIEGISEACRPAGAG